MRKPLLQVWGVLQVWVMLQVHYDIWRHPTDVQRRHPVGHTTSLAYRLLPQSLQDAYADGNARLTDLANGQVSSCENKGLLTSQALPLSKASLCRQQAGLSS